MANSKKLNNILKERYEIDLLAGRIMPSHIQNVHDYYTEKSRFLKESLSGADLNSSEDYAKAYLISEAALMILREIAPKRMNKKRKGTK